MRDEAVRTYWECVREALEKSEKATLGQHPEEAVKYAKEALIAAVDLLEWASAKYGKP